MRSPQIPRYRTLVDLSDSVFGESRSPVSAATLSHCTERDIQDYLRRVLITVRLPRHVLPEEANCKLQIFAQIFCEPDLSTTTSSDSFRSSLRTTIADNDLFSESSL